MHEKNSSHSVFETLSKYIYKYCYAEQQVWPEIHNSDQMGFFVCNVRALYLAG